MMLEKPVVYALISKGTNRCVALKMNRDDPGPECLQLTDKTRILDEKMALGSFTMLVPGDRLNVTEVEPISGKQSLLLDEVSWPVSHPPPAGGCVVQASVRRRVGRACFLAFASQFSRGNQRVSVRFYDPCIFTERTLHNLPEGNAARNEMIFVEYTVYPSKTWLHPYNQYVVPNDAPYSPDGMVPARGKHFEAREISLLEPEVIQLLQGFYHDPMAHDIEPMVVEKVLLAGAAMLQCRMDSECRLAGSTMDVTLLNENADAAMLRCVYTFPQRYADSDRRRAARAFKDGQRFLIAAAVTEETMRTEFAVAVIQSSAITKWDITVVATIPQYHAAHTWALSWEDVCRHPVSFKLPPNEVVGQRTRKALLAGKISKGLASGNVSPSTKLIAALFHMEDAIPPLSGAPTAEYLLDASSQELTAKQSQAVAYSVDPAHPLVVIQAPAGSGKTTTIASIVVEYCNKHPNACIVVVSAMNVAIDSLASALAKESSAHCKLRVLVAQSATFLAGKRADDPYQAFRLPELIKELANGRMGNLNERERQIARKAARAARRKFEDIIGMDWEYADWNVGPDESSDDLDNGIELLVAYYKPQVIVATTSVMKVIANVFADAAKHIIFEEAGTVPVVDATALLLDLPQVESLTLVGDVNQLPNYAASMPETHRHCGFNSVQQHGLTHPRKALVELDDVFRSHPAIVDVVSEFAYNSSLTTPIKHEQREMMAALQLPLARPDFPILVVNCEGDEKPTLTQSYTNDSQVALATQLAIHLASKTQRCDARFLSLYGGCRDDIQKSLASLSIPYQSTAIDAAQGQECDITVLTTAITPKAAPKSAETFAGLKERITVAISRARHGLIIIAHVAALSKIPEWERLFNIVRGREAGAFINANELLWTPLNDNAKQPKVSTTSLALQALGIRSDGSHEHQAPPSKPNSRKKEHPAGDKKKKRKTD